MNEKFFELPEEKQLRIINAGFEIFSKSDYKHASTEDIAAKAGISKGLLFYYFHNKKALFMFLFGYAEKTLRQGVMDPQFYEITDVFELFAYSTEKKYRIMKKNPHIMDFMLRLFLSQKEDVTDAINNRWKDVWAELFTTFFANADFSKFKEDVDPKEVIQMLVWLAEGYMSDQMRQGGLTDLDDMMTRFRSWMEFFRKTAYKEEYLK